MQEEGVDYSNVSFLPKNNNKDEKTLSLEEVSAPQDYVDLAYDKLSKLPGFEPRTDQIELSKNIERSLIGTEPLCAEAPTGTGKTLAYLIGSLSARKRVINAINEKCSRLGLDEKKIADKIPGIVISTATVNLQNQILENEIEMLGEIDLVNPDKVIIAKGRGRYYCPHIGRRHAELDPDSENQADMFEMDEGLSEEVLESRVLFRKWQEKDWDGDIDSLGRVPKVWGSLKSSRDSCVFKVCDFRSDCPFYTDRQRMAGAELIITNHSLVLQDLKLRKDGHNPLFPYNRYFSIFDEGHHLPDKAVETAAESVPIKAPLDWLAMMPALSQKLMPFTDRINKVCLDRSWARVLRSNNLSKAIKKVSIAFHEYESLGENGESFDKILGEDSLTDIQEESVMDVMTASSEVSQAMASLNAALLELSEKGERGFGKLVTDVSFLLSRVSALASGYEVFSMPPNEDWVRWVHRKRPMKEDGSDGDVHLCASPIEGDAFLKSYLWGQKSVRSVVVSATLQTMGSFSRFFARAAVPKTAYVVSLEHRYPYQESKIVIPKMRYLPTDNDKWEYELENIAFKTINPTEGTLILFTSYSHMKRFKENMPNYLKKIALGQGLDGSRDDILKKHAARIDGGSGSILLGVASFSEGLDLPGKYCTHLIITRVPFSVPTSPIEVARKEKAGESFFLQYALPDAALRLIQKVGRLIRRSSDRGVVTILDRRLVTRRYGASLRKSLPPFRFYIG